MAPMVGEKVVGMLAAEFGGDAVDIEVADDVKPERIGGAAQLGQLVRRQAGEASGHGRPIFRPSWRSTTVLAPVGESMRDGWTGPSRG